MPSLPVRSCSYCIPFRSSLCSSNLLGPLSVHSTFLIMLSTSSYFSGPSFSPIFLLLSFSLNTYSSRSPKQKNSNATSTNRSATSTNSIWAQVKRIGREMNKQIYYRLSTHVNVYCYRFVCACSALIM